MKKCGIFTIIDYMNYGNRLQNYAVQKTLQASGYSCSTILSVSLGVKFGNRLRRVLRQPLNIIIPKIIKKIRRIGANTIIVKLNSNTLKGISASKRNRLILDRTKAFKEFSRKNIVESNFTIAPDTIPKDFSDQYDLFLVGSDQVWNPGFGCGTYFGFLQFAPPHKRVAFSASFGVSQLPLQLLDIYSRGLKEMTHISVREEDGARIVKELTGRDVIVLVDPTMMLTREQWMEVSSPAVEKPRKPYLLTYFLGALSQQQSAYINNVASIRNLEIVNLADINDEERYVAGPDEFIDYISFAEILLTDSFHGVVFSILFEKPFIVFNRNSKAFSSSMHSRIDTILKKFGFESRKAEMMELSRDPFSIDYSHIFSILEKEREKTFDYLRMVLNDINKGAQVC